MAVNWKEISVDMGYGAAAGVADQVVQRMDSKRATDKGVPQLKWNQRWGTYFNYGVPLLAVIGVTSGMIRNPVTTTRLLTLSGELAGRQATMAFQNKSGTPVTYNPAKWLPREAVRQDAYLPNANPQPIRVSEVVPIVQPQSLFGGRGELG